MNPKITDFGMAITFGVDQTAEITDVIVGTSHYVSPESALRGEFSVKSDVFSFGILLMEIISGKDPLEGVKDLPSHAWELWKNGEPLELLDPTIRESYTQNEVMRCIHVSLLCVQKDPEDRPSISSIVLMLENYSMTLPTPSKPAFLDERRTSYSFNDMFDSEVHPISVNEMSDSEVLPR